VHGARLTERDFFDVDPKPVRHVPNPAIERDFFDVDLKAVHRIPRREMDREDPFKP
jgi:hypothetical protein